MISTGSSSFWAALVLLAVAVPGDLRHPLPELGAGPHGRGASDPRLDEAGGRLDARPGRDPPLRGGLHLLQAPGDHARGRGPGRRPAHPRRRPAVLLAVPLSQRRDRDRPARRASGPARRARSTAPESDVNHSFWILAIGGKFDAIPGRTVETAFQARRPGIFEGQCAEFCGIQHAEMFASIEVLPAEEFDSWLDDQARPRRPARPSSASRSSRAPARSATARRAKGSSAPRFTAANTSDPEAVEQVVEQAQEDARGRRGVGRSPDEGAHRLPERSGFGEEEEGASGLPRRTHLPGPWTYGRVASWVATVDHKRIGILYIATSLCSSSPAA